MRKKAEEGQSHCCQMQKGMVSANACIDPSIDPSIKPSDCRTHRLHSTTAVSTLTVDIAWIHRRSTERLCALGADCDVVHVIFFLSVIIRIYNDMYCTIVEFYR